MASSNTAVPERDDGEGLSPSPQPFGLADIWEDASDDIDFEPASEDPSQGEGETDEEEEEDEFFMGTVINSNIR